MTMDTVKTHYTVAEYEALRRELDDATRMFGIVLMKYGGRCVVTALDAMPSGYIIRREPLNDGSILFQMDPRPVLGQPIIVDEQGVLRFKVTDRRQR